MSLHRYRYKGLHSENYQISLGYSHSLGHYTFTVKKSSVITKAPEVVASWLDFAGEEITIGVIVSSLIKFNIPVPKNLRKILEADKSIEDEIGHDLPAVEHPDLNYTYGEEIDLVLRYQQLEESHREMIHRNNAMSSSMSLLHKTFDDLVDILKSDQVHYELDEQQKETLRIANMLVRPF